MKKKIKNKKRRSSSSNLKDLKIVIIDLCNSAVTPLSFKGICKELKVKDILYFKEFTYRRVC